MSLNGKVALVTGSTSGIGLGIARALGSAGASLMLNGFGDPGQIETLRAGLEAELGVRVLHDGADVSKAAAVAAMIDRATAQLGSVDILVNNAGIQHVAPIADFPVDRYDAIIAIVMSSAPMAGHRLRTSAPSSTSCGTRCARHVSSVRLMNGSSAARRITSPVW